MTDNEDTKTTAEVAAEFSAAYEAVRPFSDAFKAKVEHAIEFVRDFRRDNAWYPDGLENYDWVDEFRDRIDPLNVLDGKIYLGETGWDDVTLSFDEIDNIETIVRAKFAAYEEASKLAAKENKEKHRARLVKALADLDEEEAAESTKN